MGRTIQARGRVKYSRQMQFGPLKTRRTLLGLGCALLLAWCIGMFARGYWTPDEPREADIAWRMSWQTDRAVPLLAGEAFCEKPPLTYWLAALPMKFLGTRAWVARLPNLLYAFITALSVGLLASRSAGRFAGLVGAAAVSTFLLSYQVAIWLATDAPLLAAVSVALLGAYIGFYATTSQERLRGYLLMHVALGLGFPVQKRSRLDGTGDGHSYTEYLGKALARTHPLGAVCRTADTGGDDSHVGVVRVPGQRRPGTFENFLLEQPRRPLRHRRGAGRFAIRGGPSKYAREIPDRTSVYLFPWTLLVIAAARRAWRQRRALADPRAVRFALAASLPPLLLLSFAATARNIYLAPALPGFALLLAWWAREILPGPDRWDIRAVRATAAMLLLGVALFAAALIVSAVDSWSGMRWPALYIAISLIGLLAAAALALRAWAAARDQPVHAQWALLLAYCALLIGPASQVYGQVDGWQDLATISREVAADTAGKPLILLAPDETTRAMIDMYARQSVDRITGPLDTAGRVARPRLGGRRAGQPFPGPIAQPITATAVAPASAPEVSAPPAWAAAGLRMAKSYSLPNGRRYALLEVTP